MKTRRIEFDDDLVVVIDTKTNQEIYRGIDDYEPMKDMPWQWNSKEKSYYLDHYKKYCLDE